MKKAAFLISMILVSVMFGAVFQNCTPIKPQAKITAKDSIKKKKI